MTPLAKSRPKSASGISGDNDVLDIIFIAVTLLFFALALWYVRFCDRV